MAKTISYSYEDADEKSKKFLKDILGTELFDKLFKDGKIEVESGGNVYELYDYGKIINKTTDQVYCIIPTSPDYPTYDIIAIKYAWLKYGIKTVERVANKASLTYRPQTDAEGRRVNGVGYDAFVHYMEQQGWRREQINIDENNTSMVSTHSLSAEYTGTIINIRCPAGYMMTTKGMLQITGGESPNTAYTFVLYITDKDGKEISKSTKIRISKIKPLGEVIQLARIFYADVSTTKFVDDNEKKIRKKKDEEFYRWRNGILLYSGEYLSIDVVNSDNYIHYKDIKVGADFDIWMRDI